MHAQGCPGSHVILKSDDPTSQQMTDAAMLAARASKCNPPVVKVNAVLCGDVSKPPGAKAGLVTLGGRVKTLTIDLRKVEGRLKELDEGCVLNADDKTDRNFQQKWTPKTP